MKGFKQRQANGWTEWVTLLVLELLITAKNVYNKLGNWIGLGQTEVVPNALILIFFSPYTGLISVENQNKCP